MTLDPPLKSDRSRRITLTVIIVSFTILLDQFSKNLIRTNIGILEKVEVITPYISFLRVENSGAFLSSGEGVDQWIKYLLLTLLPSLGLLITLLMSFYRMKELIYWNVLGLSLLMGGGISNIFDRFIYRTVTDFIHINISPLNKGIFNIADIAIFTGILILICNIIIRRSPLKRLVVN